MLNFPRRSLFLSLLIQPPKHSRRISIPIVLGLCFAIAASDVAAKGTFGNLAFNILPLILAISWLGLAWGISATFLVTLLRVLGDLANAWLNPDYFFVDVDLTRIISNRISGLVMFLCIAVIIHELILLSRQLEERVQARTTALRQATAARERLQHSLLEAGMRERAAIGHDLHDGLSQHLTATAIAANILTSRLKERDHSFAESAHEVETLVRTGITQTRQIARGLLLDNVPAGQLEYELDELVTTATENFHIPCTLTTEGPLESLDTPVSSHLFYIAREAVRNALRHASPSSVSLHLSVDEHHADLRICANGQGPPEAAASDDTGGGLQIMTQRAEFIGGTLELFPPANGETGTHVHCYVPLISNPT
ncbi:MAG: sensor histidine kinase [Candidatus Synoicihabitans palmerolidicus]|nr:sensor histidine kinase [Candidatus Synoicihabitans palmerolidicus]